jgi:hypothetical protein
MAQQTESHECPLLYILNKTFIVSDFYRNTLITTPPSTTSAPPANTGRPGVS